MDKQAKISYYFLLCKECYWCASSVNLASNRIVKCPVCSDAYLKLMLIVDNETNKIDYRAKSRFTTEFGIKYIHENAIIV
jgi:hypothetical protein